MEIFLQPGEFYFGDESTRIKTLLGSCIAITMWHPFFRLGGMCHYLLPQRLEKNEDSELDGRYAEEAMLMFLEKIEGLGKHRNEFEVKMFGGGNQFPHQDLTGRIDVPEKNISFGQNLIKQHGFSIKSVHTGGTGLRNIIFDVWNGDVWVKHVDI